jgi:hypothetical protein
LIAFVAWFLNDFKLLDISGCSSRKHLLDF